MAALLKERLIEGGDGLFHPESARYDRLAAAGQDVDYNLTPKGVSAFTQLGIDLACRRSRPLVRYCIDWTEQRHHLSGWLGAALLERFLSLGWIKRAQRGRAVHLADLGRSGLRETFGLQLEF
ncbi:MAG TPA: hypothetical protein VK009_20555 [Chloroflexota bacterium]|nr:hypothetical protein [Chloroflexota bacterium]